MLIDPVFILTTLFITGLIVEAMTGAITAGQMKMDLFGVLVVANVTAFGGGVVRDVLLGHAPMLIVSKPELLFVTSVAALIMVLIARHFQKIRWILLSLDALGMITFSIVGAMRAQDMEFGMGVASIAGLTTGVFGGILRDILCNRIPLAFRKELYASISIFSVWMYLLLDHLNTPLFITVVATLSAGFCLRILAIIYDWHIPQFIYHSSQPKP